MNHPSMEERTEKDPDEIAQVPGERSVLQEHVVGLAVATPDDWTAQQRKNMHDDAIKV